MISFMRGSIRTKIDYADNVYKTSLILKKAYSDYHLKIYFSKFVHFASVFSSFWYLFI